MRQNYSNLNDDLKKELQKNEELGVELLTLVNQKNAVMSEREALLRERDSLRADQTGMSTRIQKMTAAKRDLEDKLRVEQEKTQDLYQSKVDKSIDTYLMNS